MDHVCPMDQDWSKLCVIYSVRQLVFWRKKKKKHKAKQTQNLDFFMCVAESYTSDRFYEEVEYTPSSPTRPTAIIIC